MVSAPIHLSVVVPCYNEAARIGRTLDMFHAYLAGQNYSWEIIVVDDGSDDGTAEAVRGSFPGVRVISYRPNRGKGHAVKEGMLAARGAYRLVSDADGSTPIEEIEKFWPELERGAAIVIGSRALPESRIEVRQPWYRENMGRVYNLILRVLGLTRFPDTQCGFKAFTAEACGVVFPRQTVDGFGADCELLYIATLHGLRVVQVPVRWLNSPDTRVHPVFDSLKMLCEIGRVRWNALRGRYR